VAAVWDAACCAGAGAAWGAAVAEPPAAGVAGVVRVAGGAGVRSSLTVACTSLMSTVLMEAPSGDVPKPVIGRVEKEILPRVRDVACWASCIRFSSESTTMFLLTASVEGSNGTVIDTVLAARLADGDTRTAYLAKCGRNSQQQPVAGRIQASGPRLAADVEERRKEAPTRIEQAGKALAEPFKHADALKTTKAETARIDQLMAEATKSAKQPTEHYTPEATAHQPAPDTTGRPANPNQRGTTTSSGDGPAYGQAWTRG